MKMDRNDRASLFFQILFILVCLAGVVISPFGRFSGFFLWLDHIMGRQLSGILAALIVFSFGMLAHRFKQESQYWYGVVEVLFGASYAFSTVLSMKAEEAMFARWATLFGCVYVVARGLNNMRDARKAGRTEGIAG